MRRRRFSRMHTGGSEWYWFAYWSIDPNLKYHQVKYHQLNDDLGIPEGAD